MTPKLLLLPLVLCPLIATAQLERDTTSVAKTKDRKYRPHISGVIQAHYLEEFNTNGDTIRDPGGFRILRARLTAKGRINAFTTYVLMVDPRAPEQGGVLRDAYIELELSKHQSLRVGQQKTQFGWENRESITNLYTVNRSELCDGAMRGENLRDVGVGVLGDVKLSDSWRIENAVTFTNGTRLNPAGPFDFNTKKALWGRLGLRYKEKGLTVRFGGSFATGGLRYLGGDYVDPTDDVYADFSRFGADLQLDHKLFFAAAEYAKGEDMVADTLFAEPNGYSFQIAAKTKWHAGPMARVEQFEDDFHRVTVGAYYGEPKDDLRVLLNYEFRKAITDIPEGHDDRLYLQLQVTF